MARLVYVLAALCTLSGCSALRLEASIVTRRATFAAVGAVVAKPLAAKADEILHIVDYPKPGACGEAMIPDKAVPFVKAFGGFSDGSCVSAGYETRDGTAKGTGEKDKDREYDIYVK